jgi:hypothetical protein
MAEPLIRPFDIFLLDNFLGNVEFCVELGTYVGDTSILLSKNVKRLLTVDVFEGVDLIEDAHHRWVYSGMYAQTKHSYEAVCDRLKDYKNIEVRRSLSYDAKNFADIENESVGSLFMDADHSCLGLIKEWEVWYPKVKKGAYIMVHDTFPPKESNAPARGFILSLARSQAELVCQGGDSTLLRKAGKR